MKKQVKTYEEPVSKLLGIVPVMPLCASLADTDVSLGDDLDLGYGGEL